MRPERHVRSQKTKSNKHRAKFKSSDKNRHSQHSMPKFPMGAAEAKSYARAERAKCQNDDNHNQPNGGY